MSTVHIDGKGHIEGRLAAAVAKQLLNGRKVVVVRCEKILRNGEHRFNLHRFNRFLNKTTNTNPRLGPYHERSPAEMFRRAVRGMLPYKTGRGAAAFGRLSAFVGVPDKYVDRCRVVVPEALRVNAINTSRPVTSLGELASNVGWKYADVVSRLEEKRIEKSAKDYQKRKDIRKKAIEAAYKEIGDKARKFLETYVE